MHIGVIGCGYLGAVHAASMVEFGHTVTGIDLNVEKVAALGGGKTPFHEPGFPELLQKGLASGRLSFSTDYQRVAEAEVLFIAVDTPQQQEGFAADLRALRGALRSVQEVVSSNVLVVGKSTVPVGTAAELAEALTAAVPGALLAWTPEFLREGHAIHDTLSPDRLVYGVPAGEPGERAARILDEVYAPILAAETPRLVTDYATAELVKVSANAFLATKISFINAMAEIAEATGADVTQLADAIGLDPRIGRGFLNAGLGFGGGCLPKDIRAFQARAEELGLSPSLRFLAEVDSINLRARERAVAVLDEELHGLKGRHVAVLGLSFKPDSDDVRDSPAVDVVLRLQERGAVVTATDPAALARVAEVPRHPALASTVTEAVAEAEAVAVLTEWPEYRALTPEELSSMTDARIILDARNVLDAAAWTKAGWTYRGLGRGGKA